VTARHIRLLKEDWGVHDSDMGWIDVLEPQVKELAYGDIGPGAMCDWQAIVAQIERRLGLKP
jgi:phosphopantothenoylcysteine synthetase/decarboxylase